MREQTQEERLGGIQHVRKTMTKDRRGGRGAEVGELEGHKEERK